MMTVTLLLTLGPYQVLVRVPWNDHDIEGILTRLKEILSHPAETWPQRDVLSSMKGLGPPPITVPGWV
jgi:hypothetical protein